MKALAKFLCVVVLLVALTGLYIFHACDVTVTSGGGLVESAADRIQAFDSIRYSMTVGSSSLVPYQTGISGNADQYVFVTYTLNLKNTNLLPVEWIQIDLQPQKGDVLMLKPAVEDVPPFSEGIITLVLMTDRAAASYARSATLSYYVYGHEFKIPVQLTT